MYLLKNYLFKENKRKLFEGVSYDTKKLLFIQGPAGAGKSTFLSPLESKENVFVYNVDVKTEEAIASNSTLINAGITVANAFSKKNPSNIQNILDSIRSNAADETSRMQRHAFNEGKHIIVEGTGSRFYTDMVKDYQNAGYEVMYLSIYAPLEYCIDSNWQRGICGGRTLSEYIITDTIKSYNYKIGSIIPHFKKIGVFCEVVTSLYKTNNDLYYPWFVDSLMPNDYGNKELSESLTKKNFRRISKQDIMQMASNPMLINKIKKLNISNLRYDQTTISLLSNKTTEQINQELSALIN
jgi:hypothetical protein